MQYDRIKNKDLLYKMQLLYGTISIQQLGKDLGAYERQDGDIPKRVPMTDEAPVDQSLVRRWLTGERPVPRWAEVAIADLLLQRLGNIAALVSAELSKNFALDPEWVERLHVGVFPWGSPYPPRKLDTDEEIQAWLAETDAMLARHREERK